MNNNIFSIAENVVNLKIPLMKVKIDLPRGIVLFIIVRRPLLHLLESVL